METLNFDPDRYLTCSDDPTVCLMPQGGLETRAAKGPRREYRERIVGPPSADYDPDVDSRR